MRTVILTLDLPDDLAARLDAMPPEARNHYAVSAMLRADEIEQADGMSAEEAAEPVDPAFIAELHQAFAEAERVGTISHEDFMRQIEADSGPGFVERLRARRNDYNAAHEAASVAVHK